MDFRHIETGINDARALLSTVKTDNLTKWQRAVLREARKRLAETKRDLVQLRNSCDRQHQDILAYSDRRLCKGLEDMRAEMEGSR